MSLRHTLVLVLLIDLVEALVVGIRQPTAQGKKKKGEAKHRGHTCNLYTGTGATEIHRFHMFQ